MTFTQAQIEAAAEAGYEEVRKDHSAWLPWKNLPADSQNSVRPAWIRFAKAALAAAERAAWQPIETELTAARNLMAKTGIMLTIYAEEPNEKGQKSMSGCLIDAAAVDCLSVAFPLRELCRHQVDEQAGCCRLCGINEEDIQFLPAPPEPTP